jgi:hypothetical protein
VTAIRLMWLIASFMTGIGLLSYPIAWIIIPEEPLLLMAPVGAFPLSACAIRRRQRMLPKPAPRACMRPTT